MNRRRIAVLGLYRSGSTVVAGVLHHLGVDMGAPFFGRYYESDWLSRQLRQWWDEWHMPHLREKVGQPKRVRVLAKWIKKREQAGAAWVGAKHPLLSLCGDDLVKAWGEETKFIRCCRPFHESVESMIHGMGFRGDAQLAQQTLLKALDSFFSGRQCLEISFADMINHPRREIQRLIEFLEITPKPENIERAVQFVEPGRAKVEAELQKVRDERRRHRNWLNIMRRAIRFSGK